MEPTLHKGDRVIVNKCIFGARLYTDFNFKEDGQELKSVRLWGLRPLRHNDVLVFNFPINGNRIAFKINHVYCKRCIALPGDSLEVVNGYYRNNNYNGVLGVESEQRVLSSKTFDRTSDAIRNIDEIYIPRKGDVIYISTKEAEQYKKIFEFETGKTITVDGTKVFMNGEPFDTHTFVHNYYFMAGDNVGNSNDSRHWGLVPEEYIIGVVDMVSYHKDNRTGQISSKRWLKKVI